MNVKNMFEKKPKATIREFLTVEQNLPIAGSAVRWHIIIIRANGLDYEVLAETYATEQEATEYADRCLKLV